LWFDRLQANDNLHRNIRELLTRPVGLQQRLVKIGGRLIKHARYYWLLLAESHLTRRLFGNMLQKIAALRSPAG
jgi:hypothetical protein